MHKCAQSLLVFTTLIDGYPEKSQRLYLYCDRTYTMESSPSLAPAQEWLHSLLLEATEATVSRSGLALPRCSALKGSRISAMALLCPVGGRHLSGWTYAGDLYVVTAGLFCVPSCCRCRQLWLVKYGGTQGWQCHPSVHHQSRLARSLGMLQITLSPC